MRGALLIGAVLLAGCGGKPSATVVTKDGTVVAKSDGSVTVTTANESATLTAGAESCTTKPDFAPVYAGASIKACVAGDALGRHSGSITYTVAAAPAAVLAWSKAEGDKAGLKQNLLTDSMLSASEGEKRTLAVIVTPEGSGSSVIVNWGQGS
jgi:predicted lipoprotein with Yx(FWY)xxD motif